VVKQLPDWTINALWAKPVGGRSVSDRVAGCRGDECVLHGPHVPPVRQGDDPGGVEADEIGDLVGDEVVQTGRVGAWPRIVCW
jgi:hypothetical protein